MKFNKNISTLNDEELLNLFQQVGDIAYFGELYRRYIPLVYGLCLKYLGNKDNAQDAVMDIFEKLQAKIAQYEINNFNTWLYSVAKNHCLQVLRKEKQTVFVNFEQALVENDDFFTLIDKPQTPEEITALAHCMDLLTEAQRISIVHFYIDEKSYLDIEEITGFSLKKVKSYIQNGKRNLKICLTKTLQLS